MDEEEEVVRVEEVEEERGSGGGGLEQPELQIRDSSCERTKSPHSPNHPRPL